MQGGYSIQRKRLLAIAIPASFVSDTPHLREKTVKIGAVARAAAIFRVNEIIVYQDIPNTNQNRDVNLISTVLGYIETPQYLRKKLFQIKPELSYAGILPPLRTPHHPLLDRIKTLKIGEYREGAVVSQVKEGSLADIGVEQPILVPNTRLQVNSRVTVKIIELGKNPKATMANRTEIQSYWGYKTTISKTPLGQLVKTRNFELKIATSKLGDTFTSVKDELTEKWKKSTSMLVAFGAPTQGLHEIVASENLELDKIVHYVVNMIPDQGTETIRTEEAVFASLAILNLLDS